MNHIGSEVFNIVRVQIRVLAPVQSVIPFQDSTYNANISMFAETLPDAGKPLGNTAFLQWPKLR